MVEKITQLSRGGIYIATLNPTKKNEIGKARPVVILTSQTILNQTPALVFVCPLSSKSFQKYSSLHVKILARDKLEVDSFAVTEHCRSMSINRISHPRVAQLFPNEIDKIIKRIRILIGAV